MVYDIHYDLCSIIIDILAILTIFSKKDISRRQNIEFLFLIVILLLSSIADVGSSVLLTSANPESHLRAVLFTYMYFVFRNLLPAQFAVYLMSVTGINKKHSPKFFMVFFSPVLIILAMLAVNPFTHWIFNINDQMLYSRGMGFFVFYGITVLYIAIIFYILIHYKSAIPGKMAGALAAFVIASVVTVIFQYFIPTLLIELFVQSLILLVLLFTIENEDEFKNQITHIRNRRFFVHENTSSIEANLHYSLIIIKLTNYKYYLDTVGYHTMEKMMYVVAQWLNNNTVKNAVYDCENGTFALILYGKKQKKMEELSISILERFEQDWEFGNITILFDAQITSLRIPSDINSIKDLMMLLDMRYTSDGKQTNIVQRDDLQFLKRRASIEKAIEDALKNNSFQVYLQPIWDSKTQKITCAEALVRLFDDELGFIPPDEFIPIAENNGSIIQIGDFVFNKTCEMYQKEQMLNLGIEFVDVNLSPVQCMNRSLAKRFSKIIERHALSATHINLEITEGAAINSPETFMRTMQQLRNLRFDFSLDDYGTGYSNAAYIFSMDFSIIKLDKSILWEAEQKANAKIILRNYVKMIKEMQLKIIVEGVETESQKNLVTSLGCDYCQGYYFSKPLPVRDFVEFVTNFNHAH